MRTVRLFYPFKHLMSNDTLILNKSASHYLFNVLRMKLTDNLHIFNGLNLSHQAKIISVDSKQVKIQILKTLPQQASNNLQLHLGQVLLKGSKMDGVIQKSVELGVSEITPLFSERCIIRLDENQTKKKLEHWQKIMIDACEQCGRNDLPALHPIIDLKIWLKQHPFLLGLNLNPRFGQSLKETSLDSSMGLLIGPEGGLTPGENNLAELYQFKNITLGPRILRAETASLACISTLQILAGDF